MAVATTLLLLLTPAPADAQAPDPPRSAAAESNPSGACDPAFVRLFAPPHPRVGRYEVCPSDAPLSSLAAPGWRVERSGPQEAFGSAGTYNRAALARLYRGQQAEVARGWRQTADGFESVTLISPYPDPTLTRLEPGTLIVRLTLCCT